MGFDELGACPFKNIEFLAHQLKGNINPSFIVVRDKLGDLLSYMVYEEGIFETISDTFAVQVFTQTSELCLQVADTVSRLYKNLYQHSEFSRTRNKIILSDRELPLKFTGKFYSFNQEGYLVEVGVVNRNIAIHFHKV